MATQVDLTKAETFRAYQTAEVPAGQDTVTLKFPAVVPAGKKAVVRLEVRAVLVDV